MSFSEKFSIVIPPQDIELYPDCLLLLSKGNKGAFQWLYKNYCKKIFDFTLVLTGDRTISEDIVQDVFLKIWSNKESMARVNHFNSYLFTITRNYITSYYRKQACERNNIKCYQHTVTVMITHPDDSREVLKIIREAVEKLPPQCKTIYQLSRDHNWKREKIAMALNISPNTVKAQMQKALRSVKDYVKERLHA